ncbi:MAG: F0F1 ATP synthase subunit A [Gemmatimonadaceae bacterium]|nr:F0F1 ATP synthase subunit A [Gemmatimonadaceae bacterium]
MKPGFLKSLVPALLILAAPLTLPAQEHAAPADTAHAAGPVDIITPHITNSDHMEVPWPVFPFFKEITLPHWEPIHLGPLTLDMSPSKHVVMLLIGSTVLFLVMLLVAGAHKRASRAGVAPKGAANAIEAMILYIRNEVILPNVGHHGEGFVPYLLTAFFFILTLNLLGLVPYGSTATGNISVTATLAILTFITVELAGIRAQGLGYLNTIFYWNNDLPMVLRPVLFAIMSPVEMIGKITKPVALAIRLFANMTAGHIVVLAFIGLIFTFGSLISIAPFVMAVLVMVLELLVAFLQAFIFTLLSSVFIGQIREAHH